MKVYCVVVVGAYAMLIAARVAVVSAAVVDAGLIVRPAHTCKGDHNRKQLVGLVG
jgi:hypothetical protein